MPKFGVLLPQFGAYVSRDTLLRTARDAESFGFDSVWVRDHIVYRPHPFDDQDRTFLEPMVTLAAVASVTDHLILGTACLIPYRHPIHAALSLSSLETIAGEGRVIAGFGAGLRDEEFGALGLADIKRGTLLKEQVQIIRDLWTGASVSHVGKHYSFADVGIRPVAARIGGIPIWYCGESETSVRRAVDYADGWMPGRIAIADFRNRVHLLRQLSDDGGREAPTIGAIPLVSPAPSWEAGISSVPWREMMAFEFAGGQFGTPASGGWNSPKDLDGAILAGTPADILEGVSAYLDAGVEHLVFDLRARFADLGECLATLGEDVLPSLRPPPAPQPGPQADRRTGDAHR
jgi:probable F420-dependent oxidoreductase